jgi:probable phosphoglycerate mutase
VSSSAPTTRILVLRHGESEWNALGKWQGQADPPLTDDGRQQAFRAIEKLGTFDLIACSDLQRAHETAQIIAHGIGVGPLIVDERLRETDVGEWQGLTHSQIERQWPGWLDGHRRPPSFESDTSLITRFTAALGDISELCAGGEALVVAHAGVIRVMRRALGASDPRIPNLGGCRFLLTPGAGAKSLLVEDVVELLVHGPVGEEL